VGPLPCFVKAPSTSLPCRPAPVTTRKRDDDTPSS
jgi:hypothetical protein